MREIVVSGRVSRELIQKCCITYSSFSNYICIENVQSLLLVYLTAISQLHAFVASNWKVNCETVILFLCGRSV
jgi:hypothetical protein